MKRSELEYVQEQITGGDADTPNGMNLVGSINGMLNTFDEADRWDATPSDDDWQEAHEDFQYVITELANTFADIAGNDDVLEDDEGTELAQLPNAALEATENVDLPERAAPSQDSG